MKTRITISKLIANGSFFSSTACLQSLSGKAIRLKVFLLLFFLVLFAGFLLTSPRLATTSATVSQDSDLITFAIDETIKSARAQLPGLDRGAPARPLASLIGPKGRQVDFVQNELTLVTDDSAALDAFVARWGGEVVKSLNPAEYRLTGTRQHLVRIDTNRGECRESPGRLAGVGAAGQQRPSPRLKSRRVEPVGGGGA